jgi:hypothetical protein
MMKGFLQPLALSTCTLLTLSLAGCGSPPQPTGETPQLPPAAQKAHEMGKQTMHDKGKAEQSAAPAAEAPK